MVEGRHSLRYGIKPLNQFVPVALSALQVCCAVSSVVNKQDFANFDLT